VGVWVGVLVGVSVGVLVGVSVGVGVLVGVGVAVSVGVCVRVWVSVNDGVDVCEGVGVSVVCGVAVAEGVAVGVTETGAAPARTTSGNQIACVFVMAIGVAAGPTCVVTLCGKLAKHSQLKNIKTVTMMGKRFMSSLFLVCALAYKAMLHCGHWVVSRDVA